MVSFRKQKTQYLSKIFFKNKKEQQLKKKIVMKQISMLGQNIIQLNEFAS